MYRITAMLMIVMLTISSSMSANASELKKIAATGYMAPGVAKTASGHTVRKGIASSNKYFGMTAIVYEDDNGEIGDYIGIFEILDKGGTEGLKEGTVIDIYCTDEDYLNELIDRTYEHSDGKVWVQFVEAVG